MWRQKGAGRCDRYGGPSNRRWIQQTPISPTNSIDFSATGASSESQTTLNTTAADPVLNYLSLAVVENVSATNLSTRLCGCHHYTTDMSFSVQYLWVFNISVILNGWERSARLCELKCVCDVDNWLPWRQLAESFDLIMTWHIMRSRRAFTITMLMRAQESVNC